MLYRHIALLVCTFTASASQAVDATPFLPPETDVVITIQSKQISESELLKKLGGELIKVLLKSSQQAADAMEASGLDLLKDFDRVVVGIDADNTTPVKPFALMEGKFDTKKVIANVKAFIEKNPGRIRETAIGEHPAYQVNGSNANETMYTAILSDSLLVIAPTPEAITGAFNAAAGKRPAVISRELAGVLANTKSTAPVFVQAWVKGKFANINVPNDQLKQRLQGVDWMTASANVTKDVSLNATINTPDAAAARQLSDLLGGLVLLLKLQVIAAAEDQPELKPVVELLRATRVNPKDKTVIATAIVKGTVIESALTTTPPKK